jgi:hypothetical protein
MQGHPSVAGGRAAPHLPQSAQAGVPAGASGAARARVSAGASGAAPVHAAGLLADLTGDEFWARIRDWLSENLTGRSAGLRGAGDPSREHEAFSRAGSICGGSDEIQLGIVASRALGLPREPARDQDLA